MLRKMSEDGATLIGSSWHMGFGTKDAGRGRPW
jgi:hypothetical protein